MLNEKYGVLSNHDEDFFGRFDSFCKGKEIDKDNVRQELLSFFEHNLSPHISDYVINISGQCSATPTKTPITFMGDIYYRTEENGLQVDYKNCYNTKFAKKLYYDFGIDLFEELFAFFKKNGCRYHISFRLNDCHDSFKETSDLRGELFYMAKKNGWFVGEKYGYWSTCLDFSFKEVRDIILSYIDEQISRYDSYGVEWDFSRELICFDYLERTDCCEIMNGFLRDLKKTVKKAEEKWGHPIKINVRLGRDIEQNKIFGFDVKTWIDEKLVDSITPAPRFTVSDSEMPIPAWKELVKGTDIEIYAGVEMFTYNLTYNDDKAVAALAKKYLSQGADKIYMFNYFYAHFNAQGNSIVVAKTYAAASLSNIAAMDTRYIVNEQDFGPMNCSLYRPFPFMAKSGSTFVVNTSSYDKNQKISVYIAADKKNFSIKVNGEKATEISPEGALLNLPMNSGWQFSYEVPKEVFVSGFEVVCDASNDSQIIEFELDDNAKVLYVEMYFHNEK